MANLASEKLEPPEFHNTSYAIVAFLKAESTDSTNLRVVQSRLVS